MKKNLFNLKFNFIYLFKQTIFSYLTYFDWEMEFLILNSVFLSKT